MDGTRQVYAPLGEQTITVTDADGRTKQPSELSRGTREQLFLSLRFGLIRELGQRTEPLPVVVDEVLVNFDPERALSGPPPPSRSYPKPTRCSSLPAIRQSSICSITLQMS